MQKEMHKTYLEGASIHARFIDDIIKENPKGKLPLVFNGHKIGEATSLLVSLRKEGCDIRAISSALFLVKEKWYEKYGFVDFEVDLTAIIETEKAHNVRTGEIKKAMRTLSELPQVKMGLWLATIPTVNEKLSNLKRAIREFEEITPDYFEYIYPPRPSTQSDGLNTWIQKSTTFRKNVKRIKKTLSKSTAKSKSAKILKLTQRSHMWDACKVNIVDELKRIGYSDRKAFRTTGRIIKNFYPEVYTDHDPDRVRQTYTYHKTKK